MAPRTASKSQKRSTKRKSTTRRSSGPSTNALLKRLLSVVDKSGSSLDAGAYRGPRPRHQSILSNFPGAGRPFPSSNEYMEDYSYDGQPFVRMVCPPGKRPDYEKGECVKGTLYNALCPKGENFDPFDNKCTSQPIRPRIGYVWEGKNARNIGTGYGQDSWSYGKQLPMNDKWGGGPLHWPGQHGDIGIYPS